MTKNIFKGRKKKTTEKKIEVPFIISFIMSTLNNNNSTSVGVESFLITGVSPESSPQQSSMNMNRDIDIEMVRSGRYYETFHGHYPIYTDRINHALRLYHGKHSICIWLCGDSSLDNKAWLFTPGYQTSQTFQKDYYELKSCYFTGNALNGYESILNPPGMVKDVNYWINEKLTKRRQQATTEFETQRYYSVNTAVEATTLASRTGG